MTNIFQLFLDHTIAFSISIVVTCIFAYFQWKCYSKNRTLINGLGEFFLNDVYSVGYKTYFNDDVCQIGTVNGKEQLNGLIEEINLYVQKSIGSADFNVVQNKTERKIESLYEHATAELSFPTYIGLMGTFTGTGLGLIGFLMSGSDLSDESKVTSLIIGVLVSMITSLLGLVLTTATNHRAAVAKKELDEQKDVFLDFIQLEVIPKLQTTVTTLQQTLEGFVPKFDTVINNFEKTFTGVIGRFKKTFDECTENFGTEFRQNTSLISQTVGTLNDSIGNITENVENQRKLLEELRSEKMFYTLERFVKSANTFQSVAKDIDDYNQMLQQLLSSTNSVISLQTEYANSLKVPKEIALLLNNILNRISIFEQSINSLGENLAQSQMLGNQEMLLIKHHLESFEEKKLLADRFLDTSNEELETLFREQGKLVKTIFDNYQQQLESERDNLSAFVRETMQIITKKKNDLLSHLENAFDVGNVNKMFSHLKSLPDIEEKLSDIENLIVSNEQLKQHVDTLMDSLGKLDASYSDGVRKQLEHVAIAEHDIQDYHNQLESILNNILSSIEENTSKQIEERKEEAESLSLAFRDIKNLSQSAKADMAFRIEKLDKDTQEGLAVLRKKISSENNAIKESIVQTLTFPQRAMMISSIVEALKNR